MPETKKDWGYLQCPDCGEDALPASSWDRMRGYLWTEDDEADCPACGLKLGISVEIVDDDDEDLAVAIVIEREET